MLEVNNISHAFGKGRRNVLEGVSFEINKGDLVFLLGLNGTGKTTLIRCMSGLLKPESGSIAIESNNIFQLTPNQLSKKVTVVLTGRVSSGSLSVYELVAMGRYPYNSWLGRLSKDDESKLVESIELCGISDLLERKVSELSDGEFQKVMIAKAVAQDTDFLLMDEPMTHLDIKARKQLAEILKKLVNDQGKGVLVSTHDLSMARKHGDEFLLADGNQFFGPYKNESSEFTEKLESIFGADPE